MGAGKGGEARMQIGNVLQRSQGRGGNNWDGAVKLMVQGPVLMRR